VLARLARWDRDTAGRVDRYVANSHYVAGRIRRYYNRESTVVHPPVDTTFYRPAAAPGPGPFLLAVSALVPYKRLDVAIRAAALARTPLIIVGKGPQEQRLRAISADAQADVTFTGWLPDEDVRDLYQRCGAAVMPGVEDFGMVPVEAQACGRPVVALAQGGALDSIVDGATGLLVAENSVEGFAAAFGELRSRQFDTAAIRRHAERFGKARFQQAFQSCVEESGDPAARENGPGAARYAQHPGDPAARENDPGAARYAQHPGDPAARENKQ
jgi:glycosyltransferase involved in cell wall biosynthesis